MLYDDIIHAMIESFCRPDSKHWCVECCIPGCPLLGDLSDGSFGCKSHQSLVESESHQLKQRPLCRDFSCLQSYPDLNESDHKKIIDFVKTLPDGQFNVSEIINHYKKQTLTQAV